MLLRQLPANRRRPAHRSEAAVGIERDAFDGEAVNASPNEPVADR